MLFGPGRTDHVATGTTQISVPPVEGTDVATMHSLDLITTVSCRLPAGPPTISTDLKSEG